MPAGRILKHALNLYEDSRPLRKYTNAPYDKITGGRKFQTPSKFSGIGPYRSERFQLDEVTGRNSRGRKPAQVPPSYVGRTAPWLPKRDAVGLLRDPHSALNAVYTQRSARLNQRDHLLLSDVTPLRHANSWRRERAQFKYEQTPKAFLRLTGEGMVKTVRDGGPGLGDIQTASKRVYRNEYWHAGTVYEYDDAAQKLASAKRRYKSLQENPKPNNARWRKSNDLAEKGAAASEAWTATHRAALDRREARLDKQWSLLVSPNSNLTGDNLWRSDSARKWRDVNVSVRRRTYKEREGRIPQYRYQREIK